MDHEQTPCQKRHRRRTADRKQRKKAKLTHDPVKAEATHAKQVINKQKKFDKSKEERVQKIQDWNAIANTETGSNPSLKQLNAKVAVMLAELEQSRALLHLRRAQLRVVMDKVAQDEAAQEALSNAQREVDQAVIEEQKARAAYLEQKAEHIEAEQQAHALHHETKAERIEAAEALSQPSMRDRGDDRRGGSQEPSMRDCGDRRGHGDDRRGDDRRRGPLPSSGDDRRGGGWGDNTGDGHKSLSGGWGHQSSSSDDTDVSSRDDYMKYNYGPQKQMCDELNQEDLCKFCELIVKPKLQQGRMKCPFAGRFHPPWRSNPEVPTQIKRLPMCSKAKEFTTEALYQHMISYSNCGKSEDAHKRLACWLFHDTEAQKEVNNQPHKHCFK